MDDDSILNSVKVACMISPDEDGFDSILMMYINSVLFKLNQLGIGIPNFVVKSNDETWTEFLDNASDSEAVKTYVGLSVRKMFDPPTGAVMDSLKNTIDEYEWRLHVQADYGF